MHFVEALHTLVGEGGCCGGGDSEPKQKKKKLAGEVIATKIISIEGMHCEKL